MTKITIGNDEYDVPELSFYTIEKAWPHFLAAQEAAMVGDVMGATSAFIVFLSATLEEVAPDLADPLTLKKRLKARQMADVAASVRMILIENDMLSGEAPPLAVETPPAEASPSSETVSPTFASLSPQA